MTIGAATNREDPLLGRFRARDYVATPYAHVVANGGTNFAAPVTTALAAIRAGSDAELTAAFLSADGMIARLYRIVVDNFPVMLLLVGTADGLTDIGAFPDPGSMLAKPSNSPDRRAQSDNSGTTWAVFDALSLALSTVWPTSELESSLSMGNYSRRFAIISFQTTKARWAQSSEATQAHILATLASAAARLYGVIQPDPATSTITIAVRVADATQTTTFTSTQQRHNEQAYLAETKIDLRRWSASPLALRRDV